MNFFMLPIMLCTKGSQTLDGKGRFKDNIFIE